MTSQPDENTNSGEPEDQDLLHGLRVAFVGKLGGVNRREASRLVRQQGGVPIDTCELPVDLIVLGADDLPVGDDAQLDESIRDAAARGEVQILSETQFWQRLGMVESEPFGQRLYTPAMLAQLLGVPVSIIRRWHRRGLIVPTREVHRLPYFDFQEIATARRLAELLAAGARPDDIERQLAQLARLVPDVERPLAQLSVIVQGRGLLLRQGDGLIEPGGQMRLDFHDTPTCPLEPRDATRSEPLRTPSVLPIADLLSLKTGGLPDTTDVLSLASELEDAGQMDEAIEMYRFVLVSDGPRAEICFRLAELLYASGDISAARERYSMAIELDEDYVEARANLGCVLAETGQPELALAAFEGALHSHPDYPDVHYHLARLLDDQGRFGEAESHWGAFLELAPESPWAEEARIRLS